MMSDGRLTAVQGLLRTHLDDRCFRPELIRLSGENVQLRQQVMALQEAVMQLREEVERCRAWSDKLDLDVRDLKEDNARLFEEKQGLAAQLSAVATP